MLQKYKQTFDAITCRLFIPWVCSAFFFIFFSFFILFVCTFYILKGEKCFGQPDLFWEKFTYSYTRTQCPLSEVYPFYLNTFLKANKMPICLPLCDILFGVSTISTSVHKLPSILRSLELFYKSLLPNLPCIFPLQNKTTVSVNAKQTDCT